MIAPEDWRASGAKVIFQAVGTGRGVLTAALAWRDIRSVVDLQARQAWPPRRSA